MKSSASSIIKRYNNTRRKHPLASAGLTLQESLDKERKAFSKVINEKIEIIDTSKTNIYQLRDIIINKVSKKVNLSIVSIKSFGYKFGIPEDADFIFDARCLSNPYWEKNLRNLNGKNRKIENFFKKDKLPEELIKSITIFLKKWVKVFSKQNKNYISIAVGCTGGKHRSVYIAEKLGENFKKFKNYKVLIKHRDI